MADMDGELGVDVLIIGGGLMAHYLTRQLCTQYRVAMVDDPSLPNETLDGEGYFSAGYEGNDVGRIQPARRAASYWRLWAESAGLDIDDRQPGCALPTDAVTRTIGLWTDAALGFRPTNDWPTVFDDGPLIDQVFYHLDNDVVLDPGLVLDELRRGGPPSRIAGNVTKFVMSPGATIEYVEIDVDGETIPISPRFTVLAADAANASFLNQVATRLRDTTRRKDAAERSNSCQAVRRRHVLAIRGSELPQLSGRYAGLRIASHPEPAPYDHVWLVNPPVDDTATTIGPEDLRFDLTVDAEIVRRTLDELLTMSPELEAAAPQLEWSVYVRRETQHPMIAIDDTTEIGQPVPAKMETLDIDGFMAVWPSHEAYAMVVGDVAAERIREALGDPEVFEGMQLSDVVGDPSGDTLARWQSDDFPWTDWESFAERHEFKRD